MSFLTFKKVARLVLVLTALIIPNVPSTADAAIVCAPGFTVGTNQVGNPICVSNNGGTPGPAIDQSVVDGYASQCSGQGQTPILYGYNGTKPVIKCLNSDGSVTGNVVTLGSDGAPKSAVRDQKPVDCAKTNQSTFESISCWWPNLVIYLSSLLIQLAVFIMSMANYLFTQALDMGVVQLGKTLFTGKIADGIALGWQLFRDLANIAIIGIFVFIAINMILGNTNFGDKKLIARVLVVATLLNFSFLFTTITINISNVFAVQIYRSAALQPGGNGAACGQTGGVSSADNDTVGDCLIRLMGLSTFADTKKNLRSLYSGNGGEGMIFIHALIITILMLVAAFVFLYGALLLITRMVLFVLLLATSALAFATFLLPSLAKSGYGWDKWWGALLQNALLAPFLMISLWLTLQLATGVDTLRKSAAGSLGDLGIGKPTDGDVQLIVYYLLIIGVLFAAFRIASSMSQSIGGFAATQKVLAGTGAVALGLAGAGTSYVAQRAAYGRLKHLDEQIKTSDNPEEIQKLMRQKSLITSATKMPNMMSSNFAKAGMGALGLKGAMAGQFKVDVAKGIKEKAKNLEETYKGAAMNKDREKKMKEKASEVVDKERTATVTALRDKKVAADTAHKVAEEATNTAVAKRQQAQSALGAEKTRQAAALAAIKDRRNSIPESNIFPGIPDQNVTAQLDAEQKAAEDAIAEAERVHGTALAAANAEHATAQSALAAAKTEVAQTSAAISAEAASAETAKKERLEAMKKGYRDTLEKVMGRSMAARTFGVTDTYAVKAAMSGLDKEPARQAAIAKHKEHDDYEESLGIKKHGADDGHAKETKHD